MNPKFYHGIITITQIPDHRQLTKNEKVWLCDPFGNKYLPEDERDGNYIYGTHFLLHQDTFKWEFILKEPSQERARISAELFLGYLKELYPGVVGDIRVKPILEENFEKSKKLYELVLPNPPFHKKVYLLQKILNLFCYKKDIDIDIYIFWSKADDLVGEIHGTNIERDYQLQEDYYKFKTFIAISPHDGSNDYPISLSQIRSLGIGIINSEGECAEILDPSPKNWEQILKFQVFWKNRDKINTGRFYQNIKGLFLTEGFPSWANAKSIDFAIPHNFLAPSAIVFNHENLGSFLHSKNGIYIGNWVRNGERVEVRRYLQPNDLIHHLFITGGTGTGKTYCCAHIKSEIRKKNPQVGVLIINLKKNDGLLKNKADISLKYGDEDLRVPYIYLSDKDTDITGTIESFVDLLISSIGLPRFIDHAMANAVKAIYGKYKNLPKNLEEIFQPTLDWFEYKTRYDEKTRSRAKSAIKMRAYRLLNNPIIRRMVQLSSGIPDWFQALQEGKEVFLDLSMCKSIRKKRLIVCLIMQMFTALIPEPSAEEKDGIKLKYLIILDEVSEILEKLKEVSIFDDEVVSRNYIAGIFRRYLTTSRSRGISFILTDQKPSRLYDSSHQTPMIYLIFRTPHSCSHLFATYEDELDFIQSLPHRRALLINGVKGYKYIIHTPDFKIEERD